MLQAVLKHNFSKSFKANMFFINKLCVLICYINCICNQHSKSTFFNPKVTFLFRENH